ncbi:MAG: DMT family transporter [Pseudomonadota bacterium]
MTERSNPWLAATWMMGAVASFSTMAVAGREVAVELNTFELMFYRSIIGFVLIVALCALSKRGLAQVRSAQRANHWWRNVFHFTGQNLWFYAVTVIPLSQLVALEFMNPIFVAILAPIFLAERFTQKRVIAAAMGFAGVLVVARPGLTPVEIGHVAALGAAFAFALNTLFTKHISRTDTVLCVLFWMTLSQSVFGLVLALPGGIPWPSPQGWIWVGVVGLCGITAHLALTSALSLAPAMVVAPMEFARLPVITLLGLWLYSETLDPIILAGAAIIIAGNLINILGERQRQIAQS